MKNAGKIMLRDLWVQVHLWLGLTLGVIGALLGISGGVLVYGHEIDAVLHPQRYAISGAGLALTHADYAARAAAVLDGRSRVTALRLPDGADGPVLAFARAGSGPFQRVYLDPPTGKVLDVVAGRDLIGWLHSFHESLTLREYSGREIVGAAGIAMLVSSLSGIYLWWPARRFRHALGFRPGFPMSRNLHYTAGFWGALVLALLSFTGVFLAYPDAGRSVVASFGALSPSPRGVQAPEATGRSIGPDAAASLARGLYPGARVTGIGMPAGPRGAYRVNLREPDDTASRTATVVFIDPRTGSVIQRTDLASRTRGDVFLLWQRILHEGGAFGAVGRFATFAGGMLPPLLMVTGLMMWLRKRRQRHSTGRSLPRGAEASSAST